MAEILTSVAPYLGPSGLLAAVVVYFVINGQRKETKNERDQDYKLLEYRLQKVEERHTDLAVSIKELQQSIVSLTISVNKLYILVNKGVTDDK